MADEIVEPIAPDVLDPRPLGPLAGNWRDDDAEVYESDFEQADHRDPELVTGVPHPVDTIPVVTRLITRTETVGLFDTVQSEPIQMLTADPNRKSLVISYYLPGAGLAELLIGPEKSSVYSQHFAVSATCAVRFVPVVIDLHGHTGPLWIHTLGTTKIVVSVMAVTV